MAQAPVFLRKKPSSTPPPNIDQLLGPMTLPIREETTFTFYSGKTILFSGCFFGELKFTQLKYEEDITEI